MKIILKKNQNMWFCSDSHYMHNNICRGVTRWRVKDEHGNSVTPFNEVRDYDTLEEMNDLMVQNINDSVEENDILFHLGDWSFGGFERIQEFREMIKCKNIHLLLGNHDHHIESNKNGIRKLFSSVNNYLELRVNDVSIVMCHYPIVSWNNMRGGTIMLHGHQHLKGDDRFGNGKRMDVGMCGSPEFRPYSLEEIVEILSPRTNYELIGGHHDTVTN
jgi:calcineurin-like phosphoesterase family protein